jgi:hypothetical protein
MTDQHIRMGPDLPAHFEGGADQGQQLWLWPEEPESNQEWIAAEADSWVDAGECR